MLINIKLKFIQFKCHCVVGKYIYTFACLGLQMNLSSASRKIYNSSANRSIDTVTYSFHLR